MGATSSNIDWSDDDGDTVGSEGTFVVPHRSTKNTKRWCKGRPGREHQPEIVIPENISRLWGATPTRMCHASKWSGFGWLCVHAVVCSACGKHLRGFGFLEAEECPDYDAAAAQAAIALRSQQ